MVSCPICRGPFAHFEMIRSEFANSQMDSHVPVRRRSSPESSQSFTNTGPQVRALCVAGSSNSNANSNSNSNSISIPPTDSVQSPQLFTKKKLEKLLKTLSTAKITSVKAKLLQPGHQCVLCFRPFEVSQLVTRLPVCRHQFHRECLHRHVLQSLKNSNSDNSPDRNPDTSPDGNSDTEEPPAEVNEPSKGLKMPFCPIDRQPIFAESPQSSQSPLVHSQNVHFIDQKNANSALQIKSKKYHPFTVSKSESNELSVAGHNFIAGVETNWPNMPGPAGQSPFSCIALSEQLSRPAALNARSRTFLI